MKRLAFLALSAALGAHSVAQTFTFETMATGSTGGFALTVGGVTATFDGAAGAHQVADLGTSAPAGWLSRSLLPNLFTANVMTVNFSHLLSLASFQFGDFGSEDDVMHMRAFTGLNGTGALVGSSDVPFPASMTIPGDVGVCQIISATPFQSVRIWEDGASGQNDIYIDNLVVRVVPEPATIAALGLGAAAMLRRRRK